jgi:hypothetical protein
VLGCEERVRCERNEAVINFIYAGVFGQGDGDKR